jgi:hypothetical protein
MHPPDHQRSSGGLLDDTGFCERPYATAPLGGKPKFSRQGPSQTAAASAYICHRHSRHSSNTRMILHELFQLLNPPGVTSQSGFNDQHIRARRCLKRLIHCGRKPAIDAVLHDMHSILEPFDRFERSVLRRIVHDEELSAGRRREQRLDAGTEKAADYN